MNKEKQIEEMAIELGVYACKKTGCINCAVDYNCSWLNQATRLYNAGYRKAQEVAREIFEEIDNIIESWKIIERSKEYNELIRTSYNGRMIVKCVAELKKKFTEDGK